MNYDKINDLELPGLGGMNVILGKNGCGKSHILKHLRSLVSQKPEIGMVRYISPERAGSLVYEPGIDQAMSNDANWINNHRSQNQSENFKQQSVSLYRQLEISVLREIERLHRLPDYVPISFQDVVDKINTLLDRVEIVRSEMGFSIVEKSSSTSTSPSLISSGESQLISLAIEFMAFVKSAKPGKENILLIDEPDVHLHPDLQHRLAIFLAKEMSKPHLRCIIATHSTSFVAALAENDGVQIAFMKRGDMKLVFEKATEVYKRILPIFGAHPLSNVFNDSPILLVEGEDDERIWQQAVRSAEGKIKLFPCATDSVVRLNEFERDSDKILTSVYDNAKGFSLRDRDEGEEAIEDLGNIVRMRLACRAAENLMLSDEVLHMAGTDWEKLKESVDRFVQDSHRHPYHEAVRKFQADGMDRKNADLKDIRMVLASFFTKKPWEVIVGQSIAKLVLNPGKGGTDSLRCYLGDKASRVLLGV